MTKISYILYQLELRCIQQMIRTRNITLTPGWGYGAEVPGDWIACMRTIETALDSDNCDDVIRVATHTLIYNYNMYPVVYEDSIYWGNASRFVENYFKYEEFGCEIAMACAILLDRQFHTIVGPAEVNTKPILKQIELFSHLGFLTAYVQSVVCCVFDAHEVLVAFAHALQEFETPFEIYWTRRSMQMHKDVTFNGDVLLPSYVTDIALIGESSFNKQYYGVVNELLGTQGVTATIKCLLECIDTKKFEKRYLS